MSAVATVPGVEQLAGKYLTFDLDNEQFGVEILKVREIIRVMNTTTVPGSPPFIRGVINLRGKIIPVLELRSRFGLDGIEDGERTCIIVVEVTRDDRTVEIGLVVDSVREVLNVGIDDVEPPPEFGANVESNLLLGIARSGDAVRILLDVDRVVTDFGEVLSLDEQLADVSAE